MKNFKSGYVSVLGLPNSGKSTFINKVIGTHLMAVSKKPQTTRNNILGIFNTPKFQMLFLDTPGYHESKKVINKYIINEALKSIDEADVILYLFDGEMVNKNININDEFIEKIKIKNKKIIPVLSKIDLLKKHEIENIIKDLTSRYDLKEKFSVISVPESFGIVEIISRIENVLPIGPMYYPNDELTDRDLRFLCSEIIREKVFILTREEVPYSVAVEVVKYEEKEKLDRINADIYVEKDSQKGILIGQKGKMLKEIGTLARKDIETLVDKKVYLELFVKVRKDWTSDERFLKELVYK